MFCVNALPKNSHIMSQPSTPALQPTYMKVFIQRDYSDGTSVKFQTRFPPELEGRVNIINSASAHFLWSSTFHTHIALLQIERQQFEATINKLNEYFAEAEKGSCSTYWYALLYHVIHSFCNCVHRNALITDANKLLAVRDVWHVSPLT